MFDTNKIQSSLGCTILLKNTTKVIGIVKQINKSKNFGNFIYEICSRAKKIVHKG